MKRSACYIHAVPVTIALFDIDGTLLRAGGAGRCALELALAEVLGGRDDLSLASVEFAGRTDPWIVAEGLAKHGVDPDEALVTEVLERYVAHLPGQLDRAQAFEVLPGAVQLLSILVDLGNVALGLGTGNTEPAAYAKLARGGLDSFFSFGGFGSDHSDRAQLLRIGLDRGLRHANDGGDARAVVIGDTPHDVRAAQAIGAECIAVSTGYYPAEALEAAGARIVVSDLRAPEVLRVLG
jgi:phosphoglycolate phosphatase-like HAD superfamily hydrolase